MLSEQVEQRRKHLQTLEQVNTHTHTHSLSLVFTNLCVCGVGAQCIESAETAERGTTEGAGQTDRTQTGTTHTHTHTLTLAHVNERRPQCKETYEPVTFIDVSKKNINK